jgi:hypothetical protein
MAASVLARTMRLRDVRLGSRRACTNWPVASIVLAPAAVLSITDSALDKGGDAEKAAG